MKKVARILLIANFLNIFGYFLFAPLYAIFTQKIDSNLFIIASTYGIYAFVTGVSLLFFGKIEDSIRNKKRLVVVGYLILAFGAFSFIFVTTISQLIIVQIVNAIGTGIVTPIWKALYSQYQDKGKEAREWSFYDGGNAIIIGIASIVGGFIVSRYGFPSVIFTMGVMQLLSAFISIRLLKLAK